MKTFTKLLLCAVTFTWSSYVFAADEEVEVLAKGPVHEAYAEPSERQPTASPVVPKQPPKPIEELPPDQKPEGDNVQWIPGYWAWDEERKDFLWISGFWRNPPPERTWMPGSWQQTAEGWQWSGGFWAPVQGQKAELEYLPQPPAPLDIEGANVPAPSAEHVYVPGSWVYRQRYVWRPGYWTAYRSNWVWQSAHYRWTPGGYVFIDGYWDYPLAGRGCLFAPVYIPPTYYAAPAYVYTPTVIVREPCLYGAFFTRRGYGSYYFGDYFAPNYATIGFTAWSGHISATVVRPGFYDPLFSHYSIGYARDPFWGGGGMVNLYVGRYRGDYARPPVNFNQQNVVINNIKTTNITNVKNVTNINNVQMLSTLKDAPTTTNVKLQNVPDSTRRQLQSQSKELTTMGVRRAEQERQYVANTPKIATGKVDTARVVKMDVPTVVQPKVTATLPDPVKPGQKLPMADQPRTGGLKPTKPEVDPKLPTPKTPVVPTPLPTPKMEPKTPVVPTPKLEPKTVTPTPKVEPKSVTPMPKVEIKPTIPTPKVPPMNVPPVIPKSAPAPVPMPAPVVIPKPAPVPMPAPVVIPKPAPAPMPAPVVIPKPAPAPMPAPVVIPKPAPIPAPIPAPAPAPKVNPEPPRVSPTPPAPKSAPKPGTPKSNKTK